MTQCKLNVVFFAKKKNIYLSTVIRLHSFVCMVRGKQCNTPS